MQHIIKKRNKKIFKKERAIKFEYYGHNGIGFCTSKETAHELTDITNTNECGPIEERFWKEPANRARKLSMRPPQSAEYCRIMDVISVTPVCDLLELDKTAAGTTSAHCVSASVPLETVMNMRVPMSERKRKQQQWRENQTNTQKRWVLSAHSTC